MIIIYKHTLWLRQHINTHRQSHTHTLFPRVIINTCFHRCELMADAAYQTLVEGEAALEDAYACRDAAEASLDKLSSLLREAEAVGAEEAMRKLADMTGPVAEARSACRELELEMGGIASEDPYLQEESHICAKRLHQLLKTLDFLRATRRREVLLSSCRNKNEGFGVCLTLLNLFWHFFSNVFGC